MIEGTLMSKMTNNQVLELRGWDKESAEEYAKSMIPMGRFTDLEEVVEAMVRIMELPDYINGSCIDMTGGI
jgi:NAD(P)-dependent dehydrogenase (short-subunit alcohol dehydrogenase family)